jgi:hypothetical protein
MEIMRHHWTTALLLGSVTAVGCGGAGQNAMTTTAQSAVPVVEAASMETPQTGASSAAAPLKPASSAAPAAPKPRLAPAAPLSAPARSQAVQRPAAPPKPRFREVSAPVGTSLALELTSAISTETAQVESPVTATLRQPVVVDGVTVFPAGAIFHGSVTEVERAGRVRGRSHLAFRFNEVTIDEQRDSVSTGNVSFEGEATKSEDATKVGAGTGVGALIGGIVGGAKGAVKGAAIGTAAGVGAVLGTRGRDVVLDAGTEVTTTLSSPYAIRVSVQ